MSAKRAEYYDEFIVESLIQRYPVANPSAGDKVRASQILRDKGFSKDEIAAFLRCSPRHITRMINREVKPMPDIANNG